MSSNIFSTGLDLQQDWIYSIQALWSGSALGTLKLQISNDNVVVKPAGAVDPAVNVVNWTDYTGSLSSTSGAAGSSNFMWNVLYPGYRWVRAAYVNASGSGALTIQYFGKSN